MPAATATPDPFSIFNRSCNVTVGPFLIANIGQVAGLDVWFQVKRALKAGAPNHCDVKLYNLSNDTRAAIASSAAGSKIAAIVKGKGGKVSASATHPVPVTIEAGYVGNMSLIFAGQLRSGQTVQQKADYVTELTVGDGDDAQVLARTSAGFGPGTNAYIVALQLISDMGGKIAGNLAAVAAILKASPLYKLGTVAKGNSYDLLQDLAQSCGLEVSFQAGVLQWVSQGQPLTGQGYLLSTGEGINGTGVNTGVYDSPSVDTKGVLNLKTPLLPGLGPGSLVQVETLFVNGIFRISDIETTGETRGADWGHTIQAKVLAP